MRLLLVALITICAVSLCSADFGRKQIDPVFAIKTGELKQPTSRIVTPSPTSIAAFVGRAAAGPTDAPTHIKSLADFTRLFGAPAQCGALGSAVSDYFANGGTDAIVVRVDPLKGADDLIGRRQRFAHTGLFALDKCDTFNLLCIPPYTGDGGVDPAVITEAAAYCEQRDAILIVDPPAAWSDYDKARAGLALIGTTTKNAAVYFPRIRRVDSATGATADTAPSGAVAGVIARTDLRRGVWKSPAGMEATLTGITSLTTSLTDGQISDLNVRNINCLRPFPGMGVCVWGGHTLSTDPEWKYLSVRRLALHIETSVTRSTSWANSEVNAAPLWASLRSAVGEFMRNLWVQGAFAGQRPEEAYFVKCGLGDTMTPTEVAEGRVLIEMGFAALRPAEFVIIRASQSARKP